MNKELILKAVNLVFEFNEKFYCAEKLFVMNAAIEVNAKDLKLCIHKHCSGWVYYENSGTYYEKSNEENLNDFIKLLTKLMEESK